MHFPAECPPFFVQRFDADHVVHLAVELEAVAVDNRDQMFGVVVGRTHGRFPDLAFLHFAVSKHDEHVIDFTGKTLGQAHAQATGESVADGAG
ncbi:hypothetical protein D3C87_1224630 [compost metagenome]